MIRLRKIRKTQSVTTKEATYAATGQKSIHCSICGAVKDGSSVVIPQLKKKNPITVKAKAQTIKLAKLKKKNQTVKAKKAFTVKKAQGKVTYKVAAYDKKAKKKIKVSSSGKVTVKKGLKKGTYKVKVKVTAAGISTGKTLYKAGSETVTLTIKVK